MKTLPDNPSLGHLRRQAKDLLAGLRDSWPDASLADAQASLAQQYGFGTWPELKAEVDRMRGKADLADEGLARAIAERYGLGDVTGAMRSLARPDDSGRQWSLETTRGRWAVRTLDTWIPIVDAEADTVLQLAAAKQGIALPAPVRSGHGSIVESIGGHNWRAPMAPLRAATVGTGERHDNGRRRRDPREPAPVLCHNNLTPGNVRLGQNNQVIVFGWDHAGGQPPAWELCEALTRWALDPNGGVNAKAARDMVDGYRRVSGSLPPLDITTFRGTAIGLGNYVAGEIDRALDVGDDEDQRHADRSVQHLRGHLPTRATFARLLEEALATHVTSPSSTGSANHR